MRGFWRPLIFGSLVGLVASSLAVGPAAMLRLKDGGAGQSALLECVIAIGATSLILNGWMLVSRTVWKAPDRKQVVSSVLTSYLVVFLLSAVFLLVFSRI
jgi:hypothetical protein